MNSLPVNMNSARPACAGSHTVVVRLDADAARLGQLRALQVAFAQLCNAIAPVVQQTRCWNRVALHHLVYRPMRERFPTMGSQMVCNAIYSVSRTARVVLQHPASPWNVQRHPERALPLIRFADNAPVYFDRHTLSLKAGVLSMFTLDGRIRFEVRLDPADEQRFHRERLTEVVLAADTAGYALTFHLAADTSDSAATAAGRAATAGDELPEYVLVVPPAASEPATIASGTRQTPQGAEAAATLTL